MDPALQELLKGDEHDEIEILIKLKEKESIPNDIRVISQLGEIISARARRGALKDIWSDKKVVSIKAPRYLSVSPSNDIIESLSSEILLNQKTGLARREELIDAPSGRNIYIGIADWGFDYTHSNFINKDGTTRFSTIWDQGEVYDGHNKYGYGTIYTSDEINDALKTDNPFETLGYQPSRGGWFKNGTHGTHVLDIAAGNGNIGESGIAPESKIIAVHLAAGKIPEQFSLGDSVRVFESIAFIDEFAGNNPLVYNFSVGNHGDAHTGNTLLEQAIDILVNEKPGRAFVQSTGNYYGAKCHTNGTLTPGKPKSLNWIVDKADYTPNELEIFYNSKDKIKATLKYPKNDLFIETTAGQNKSIVIDDEIIGNIYHRVNEPNSGKNHIDIFLYPNAPPGIWQVKLFGESIIDGRYFSWIERDGGSKYCQSRFDERQAKKTHTTGTVANGFYNIAVGAYDENDSEKYIAPFSSSGPTVDGRIKPDLVAPGVNIQAAKSSSGEDSTSQGELTIKSGTSMAAPHVTGALALLFEMAPEPLTIQKTRSILLSSLDPPPININSNGSYRYGHGYLNIPKMINLYSDKIKQPKSENVNTTKEKSIQNKMLNQDTIISDEVETSFKEFIPELQGTKWNTYIYVVGTDRGGGGDFNEMRKRLLDVTNVISPSLVITLDFQYALNSGGSIELRYTYKKSKRENSKSGKKLIPHHLNQLFKLIKKNTAILNIKHLHILSHAGERAIYYTSHAAGYKFSDIQRIFPNQNILKSTFSPDAIVKIHGCQHSEDILQCIREFCAQKGQEFNFRFIQKAIKKSFAYNFAKYLGIPIWAGPLGTDSSYQCSYLPRIDQHRRFCMDIDQIKIKNAISFFGANYHNFFQRKPEEIVFDYTFHMKYKPNLLTVPHISSFVNCSSNMPKKLEDYNSINNQGEQILESENVSFIENEPVSNLSEFIPELQGTKWNSYIYIVGTDRTGGGDFNEMRKRLLKVTKLAHPSIVITFDFHPAQTTGGDIEFRYSYQKNDSTNNKSGKKTISHHLDKVFTFIKDNVDILNIKHLHFLTHFYKGELKYSGHKDGYKFSDITNIWTNKASIRSSFSEDAIVKIHGCQFNEEALKWIKDYCANTSRKSNFNKIHTDIKNSLVYNLANFLDLPVLAGPIGTYSSYDCNYISDSDKGRIFCIEENRFKRTIRFYNTNYNLLFNRDPDEVVFDYTYHMSYKPTLLKQPPESSFKNCSPIIPARIDDYLYTTKKDSPLTEQINKNLTESEELAESNSQFKRILNKIKLQLNKDIDESNKDELLERFKILRNLFLKIPNSHIKKVYKRLKVPRQENELYSLFNQKLNLSSRKALLCILLARFFNVEEALNTKYESRNRIISRQDFCKALHLTFKIDDYITWKEHYPMLEWDKAEEVREKYRKLIKKCGDLRSGKNEDITVVEAKRKIDKYLKMLQGKKVSKKDEERKWKNYLKKRGKGTLANIKIHPKIIDIDKGEAVRISFQALESVESVLIIILKHQKEIPNNRIFTLNKEDLHMPAMFDGTWSGVRKSPPTTGTFAVHIETKKQDGSTHKIIDFIRVINKKNKTVRPRHKSGTSLDEIAFNGNLLTLTDIYKDSSDKRSISAKAVSGLVNSISNSPGNGAIPDGRYLIKQKTVQFPKWIKNKQVYENNDIANVWGPMRIPLYNTDESPTKYYIHLDAHDKGTKNGIAVLRESEGTFNQIISVIYHMQQSELFLDVDYS